MVGREGGRGINFGFFSAIFHAIPMITFYYFFVRSRRSPLLYFANFLCDPDDPPYFISLIFCAIPTIPPTFFL